MNRLQPSDGLSTKPNKYKGMLWSLRDAVLIENDFSRIVSGRDYLFGLCAMGFESTSPKYRCPFDYRTPYADEDRTLLYFSPYQSEELTSTKEPKCKKFCSIKVYLVQNKIDEKDIQEIFRNHPYENVKLSWHLKQIMRDFTIKV